MNNEIQTFSSSAFGSVRTVMVDDEPWFVGKDVAEALGYANPQKAIRDHVELEDRGVNESFTPGGNQQMIIINESGLYSLVLSSKLPTARQFRRWITSEVIPSLRKYGTYSVSVPKSFSEALLLAARQQEKIESQAAKIEADRPKVVFADAIIGSKGSCLVGELAKMLRQNGIIVGQNRLFAWFRQAGYLGKSGEYYNLPLQKYVEQGLFEIKYTTHSEGDQMVTRATTKVTPKGQMYFINNFKNGNFVVA